MKIFLAAMVFVISSNSAWAHGGGCRKSSPPGKCCHIWTEKLAACIAIEVLGQFNNFYSLQIAEFSGGEAVRWNDLLGVFSSGIVDSARRIVDNTSL